MQNKLKYTQHQNNTKQQYLEIFIKLLSLDILQGPGRPAYLFKIL